MDLQFIKSNSTIRWIAVIPLAIIARLAISFPIHWFVMYQYIDTPDIDGKDFALLISPPTLETFFNAFFTPFILIFVGSIVAPKFKFATGISIAVLLGVLYGYQLTIIAGEIESGIYTPARWARLGVTILIWIAGFATGLYHAYKAENDFLKLR